MNSLIEHIIKEYTFNNLRAKQRSIGRLFPNFGQRVRDVAAHGGVSMREQMPEWWHFEVASGTKEGVDYDVYVQFLNLDEMIKKYAGDRRLWNQAGDNIDYRLLAEEVLNHVDMRTSCSCPATLYWGQDYIRTQKDAQFGRQEDRVPNKKNPHQYGAYCKHGQLVFNVLPAYTTTFASFLKKYWTSEVSDAVELAKEEYAGVKVAAGELRKKEEERPVSFARGGEEVPPEDLGEEPPEEETPPPLPPGPKEPPKNIKPSSATTAAGRLPGKATRPGIKKLGIEQEEGPKDKERKGKYRPNE